MTTLKENRIHNRFAHKATLICSTFNTDNYYNTQKCNHGGGGLCFECGFALKRGTVLNIRLKNCSTQGLSPDTWEGFRTISIAEVKWCRKTNDATGNHYNVGVKYYDPAY